MGEEQVPDTRCQVSGVRCQLSRARFQATSARGWEHMRAGWGTGASLTSCRFSLVVSQVLPVLLAYTPRLHKSNRFNDNEFLAWTGASCAN